MADAALAGAKEMGDARALPAMEAEATDLLAATGYVFSCPENLASMSGEMKAFFDRTYYPVLGRIEGRPFATLIAAGSDGEGTQRQIDRIATGWRLRRVAAPVIARLGVQTPDEIMAPKVVPSEVLGKCREMGQLLSSGLSMGIF
ncbi:flavodoxin family protein [Novosphingobium cyanobacteriorum]|uniref:NAD(P)H-dependent oxidoreductase n=1 Tax=Novosphingobium cyanobacteriorum TaxID=3024215 RepID=A0ABT6CDW1_9SPHN|nr:NAD(P)H-dependent oxidoreductase [Novosphingobium cyanobacteriorum]MDF8331643.1 NAD(P)H-dependent oxidoreductase [Novosphingobium cyanobacteriorum]